MRFAEKINPKSLKGLCWARGLSVAGLSRRIGKARQVVYAAAANPRRYPIAFAAMERELLQHQSDRA